VGPIEIKPGNSRNINVEIRTLGHKDSYKKEINVTTNDPNKGAFVLTIYATIREILSITPPYIINFEKVAIKSRLDMPIKVTNNGKVNVIISVIDVNPALNLSISPSKNIIVKPGKTKDLLLKLDSGKDPGIIEGTILMKTNIPILPEKIIPVRAEVLAK
jgi:hypothetical protein